MYIPNHFKIEDKTIVEDFISTYSFGTLISSLHSTRNWAVHLPFQWHSKPDGILSSHLAIQNELAISWQNKKQSLMCCVFFKVLMPIFHQNGTKKKTCLPGIT